jgi:hypothetical protein
MQVQMGSGNCDIVASNEVFLFDDSEELVLHIFDDDNSHCCLTLRFIQDQSKKQRVEPQVGDDGLTWNCYNFNTHLGAGLKKPVLVGESNGKGVYIIFWTKIYGTCEPHVRSVQFTVFRER